MQKRAQAAMEFMLSYGWAIVVVITAISALAYFGVLNPFNFTRERCIFPAGLSCLDFAEEGTTMKFVVKNNLGKKIEDISISIGACSSSTIASAENGEKFTVEMQCGLSGGGKYNID